MLYASCMTHSAIVVLCSSSLFSLYPPPPLPSLLISKQRGRQPDGLLHQTAAAMSVGAPLPPWRLNAGDHSIRQPVLDAAIQRLGVSAPSADVRHLLRAFLQDLFLQALLLMAFNGGSWPIIDASCLFTWRIGSLAGLTSS
jgi:hypothetical protein